MEFAAWIRALSDSPEPAQDIGSENGDAGARYDPREGTFGSWLSVGKLVAADNHNTLSITETVFRRKLRPFGKTVKSLGNVHLPDGLAAELLGWKADCPDPRPNAFIFAAESGGVMDIGNYRNRVLQPIADDLKLPKLNFQVLRRSTATQAQRLGSVKDIQAHLRHSRADTTANEYMQELPDSVKEMVGSVYDLLTKSEQSQADGGKSATKLLQRTTAERHGSPNLLPNATNSGGHAPASC